MHGPGITSAQVLRSGVRSRSIPHTVGRSCRSTICGMGDYIGQDVQDLQDVDAARSFVAHPVHPVILSRGN